MLEDKEAIIFDLDGTLVDSMWMWKDIDMEFMAERGLEFPPNLQKDIEGMSFNETAMYFIENFDIKESVDELKVIWNDMAYYKYSHVVRPKPGAIAFIERAKKMGLKLVLQAAILLSLLWLR